QTEIDLPFLAVEQEKSGIGDVGRRLLFLPDLQKRLARDERTRAAVGHIDAPGVEVPALAKDAWRFSERPGERDARRRVRRAELAFAGLGGAEDDPLRRL